MCLISWGIPVLLQTSPLALLLLHPIQFGILYFHLKNSQGSLKINFPLVSLLTHWLFCSMLFNLHVFIFPVFFLQLISSFIWVWWKSCMLLFESSYIYWDLWPNVVYLPWQMFHMYLRLCILLLLNGINTCSVYIF